MLQKKQPITEQEALLKLSALCARAEHSSGEMLEKMRRWQLPDDARERVLDRLIDSSLLTTSGSPDSSCARRYASTTGDDAR